SVHVNDFGDDPRFTLGPTRARAAATQFALREGFDAAGYRSVATPETEWDDPDARLAGKYFVARRDIAYLENAFHCDVPLHGWRVRFFKPLQHEEMRVSIDPDTGRVFGFEHAGPEDQQSGD